MKKTIIVALAVVASGVFTTATAAKKDKKSKITQATETVALKSETDSISYAAGMTRTEGLMPYLQQSFGVGEKDMPEFIRGYEEMMKRNFDQDSKAYAAGQQIALMVGTRMLPFVKNELKNGNDTISDNLFHQGFIAALKKDNGLMTDSVAKLKFTGAEKAATDRKNMETKKKGENFLSENAKKEGVVTLPSGLQYKVITEGKGNKPKETDRVEVKYEGKTIDGKVFDSSYKRKPDTTTFGVTQVIKGWTEALQLMPVGSKWELYIPYNLAYGERGAGRDIKPYDALVFTVELVNIVNPEASASEKSTDKTAVQTKATAKKTVAKKVTKKNSKIRQN